MKTFLQTPTSKTHKHMVSIPGETASLEATAKPALYRQIKLALDVHAADLMVVRRVDGPGRSRPRR